MAGLAPLTVHAYDALTGGHVMRVPYTACSWSDSLSEPGSMTVEVVFSSFTSKAYVQGLDLYDIIRPWKTILSVERTHVEVKHAGVVVSRNWDPTACKLTVTCGGGWTLLGKRLVLNHALDASFVDGDVLVDEDHPMGAWALTLNGSYRDIARGLIAETLKWGQLPFKLPPFEGGSFTRTYGGYDLATVADRLSGIADIENGDEIRFTPSVDSMGRISFLLEAEPEIIDHEWQWNALVPGQRVQLTGYGEDGADMVSDVWAAGGKNDDKTVMARARSTALTNQGYPLLQGKNTEHTTVSVFETLHGYASAQVVSGSTMGETIGLTVGEEYDVHVGDHASLRFEDDFLHARSWELKITDVSGADNTDWLSLQARRIK